MELGDSVAIYSFKHNGTFHRLWEDTILLEQKDDYIVVGNIKAKVTESDGRFWEAREPAITFFSVHSWFNVICMIRPTGIHYYCNIASPCVIIKDTVNYIDYDLDVGMSPEGNIRIFDEGEYHKHAELMGYSPELDYALKKAMYDVIKKCKNHTFPFVDDIVNDYYQKYLELAKICKNK